MRLKLLVLASRFPLPLQKGDKLRLFHQIKYLSQHHDVVLVSLVGHDFDEALASNMQAYCSKTYVLKQSRWKPWFNAVVGMRKGMPANVGYFYDKRDHEAIRSIINQEKPDRILVQLIRMAPYVEGIKGTCMAIDYMDAFSLRSERRSNNGGWSAYFWQFEQRLLERYERKISDHYDHRFIISEVDRTHLQGLGVGEMHLLKNGVDLEYFNPPLDSTKDYELVLVGNMSYHPNVLAAEYLVQKIGVPLRNIFPKLKVLIAGAEPAARVRSLANNWVTVTGFLPDIRVAYQQGKILVAPIFSGSGLQNKILEALAMGLPCVTTSMVNASIGAPDSIVREANDADSFMMEVSKLLELKNWKDTGQMSRAFVEEHFSWSACCQPLSILRNPITV